MEFIAFTVLGLFLLWVLRGWFTQIRNTHTHTHILFAGVISADTPNTTEMSGILCGAQSIEKLHKRK